MMRKTFRHRAGTVAEPILQVETMDHALKTALWNCIYRFLINEWIQFEGSLFGGEIVRGETYRNIHKDIYTNIFNYSIDDFTRSTQIACFKSAITDGTWDYVYEVLEEVINIQSLDKIIKVSDFITAINYQLEKHNSGWRLIHNQIVPIYNNEELKEVQKVQEQGLGVISEHLKQALVHLKSNGDLRNSVKESISMVEAAAKILSPKEPTLGKALNKLKKDDKVNSLLTDKYTKFYEYTNSKDGIRHGLMETLNLSLEDARYFFIACSAFTNYLLEKARKQGVI